MNFKDAKNTEGLEDYSLCVVTTKNNWCKTEITMAVFFNNSFYDTSCFEEEHLNTEMWNIDDYVVEYCYTGKKYNK